MGQTKLLDLRGVLLDQKRMIDVDLLLLPRFPMLSVSGIIEPLRVANRELPAGDEPFNWRFVSLDGEPVASSSQLLLDTHALADLKNVETLILLSSYKVQEVASRRLMGHLRELAAHGTALGCVDTAVLVFAQAGILGNQPISVHQEVILDLRQRYPRQKFVETSFSFSPKLFSSVGGVATVDMTLSLIAHHKGEALANEVARILTRPEWISSQGRGWVLDDEVLKSLDPVIARTVALLRDNLEEPMTAEALAERMGLSFDALNRRFKRQLDLSLKAYMSEFRLQHARILLINASLPIGEIAAACGYSNHETLCRAFRTRHGQSPTAYRQQIRASF